MRFAVVSAFLPTEEIAPVAIAADEFGYDGLTIADHVVDLETLATPYPYTDSGERRWDETCEWPDPWVLVGALAAQTTRLRFFTSIYVAAMRSPYQVAKSVGTAAVLRRAARYDGRIGDICTVDEAVATAGRLRALREEAGLDGPFEIIPALSDAILPEDFARAREGGVTEVMTAPWRYYFGRRATLEQKLEGLERFRGDVLAPLS
jgi:hypothetical protein